MAQGYHDSDVIFTEESLIGFIKSIHDNIGDNYHFVSTIDMMEKYKNSEQFNNDEIEIDRIFGRLEQDELNASNTPQYKYINSWNFGHAAQICIINNEIDIDVSNLENGRYTWVDIANRLRFQDNIINAVKGNTTYPVVSNINANRKSGTFVLNENNQKIWDCIKIKGFDNDGNFDNSNDGDNIYIKSDILLATKSLGSSTTAIPAAYITNAFITNLKTALTSEKALTITDPTDAVRGSGNGINAGDPVNSVSGSINTLGGIAAAKDIKGYHVHAAVFNDYAECRKTISLSPGHVVIDQDDGSLACASARLQPGAQVISDTYGNLMGETSDCQTPIAVAGRVLVYPYQNRENYHAGMAVCSAPDGTVDIMTREEIRDYPDCIVGIVSEIPQYEKWGSNQIDVDGRIWIKVK